MNPIRIENFGNGLLGILGKVWPVLFATGWSGVAVDSAENFDQLLLDHWPRHCPEPAGVF